MITFVETETPVDFVSLWGEPIEALLLEVEETDDDEVYATVMLRPEAFAHVIASEAFCLLEEAMDEDTGPMMLDPEKPVKLRLRLRPGVRTFVAARVVDIGPSVMNALGGFHPLSPTLRQSEAWLLCTATQLEEAPAEILEADPDATLEMGLQTAWAR